MAPLRSSLPTLLPLGEDAILIRFSTRIEEEANIRAIAVATALAGDPLEGAVEIVPNLVSVLVRYDRSRTTASALCGALRLRLGQGSEPPASGADHSIPVAYGGDGGPDLEEVARSLGLDADGFVERHSGAALRVLATGFAPGFVYCGLHDSDMTVPRRQSVRDTVPAGTILFAAGQTAITATPLPTGWHVIGRTPFRNFHPRRTAVTTLRPGDRVTFVATP